MKTIKRTLNSTIAKLAKKALVQSSNSTTSGALYQPKAPAALKKFGKIADDK